MGVDLIVEKCDIHSVQLVLKGTTSMNITQLHISDSEIGSSIKVYDGKAVLKNCTFLPESIPDNDVILLALNSTVIVKSSHFGNIHGKSFLKVTSGKVQISDVKFENCLSAWAAILVLVESFINVTNCKFTKTGGTSLELTDRSAGLVSNSTFENNRNVSATVHQMNSIFVAKSSLEVKTSRFYNNTISVGSTIFFQHGIGLLEDSYFINNTNGFSGAAVYTNNSQISFHRCNFIHNKGGALRHDHNPQVTISRCFFVNNSAPYGGAVRFASKREQTNTKPDKVKNQEAIIRNIVLEEHIILKSGANIFNCTFTNNRAENGGAIYSEHVSLVLKNNNFVNNSAVSQENTHRGRGGAIFHNSTFCHNHASIVDGEIKMLSECQTNIQESSFVNNTASRTGGAMYVSDSNIIKSQSRTERNISNCRFTGNTAENGGAIVAGNVSLVLDKTRFENNSALNKMNTKRGIHGLGGAVILLSVNRNDSFKISDSCFMLNQASKAGGAIFTGSQTKIYGSVFVENKAVEAGGAAYLQSIANIINFSSRTVTDIWNCTFVGNIAGQGGAIFARNMSLVLNTNRFEKNSASHHTPRHKVIGGAVLIVSNNRNDKAQISDSHFVRNSASNQGGAIASLSETNIQQCTFIGNNVVLLG